MNICFSGPLYCKKSFHFLMFSCLLAIATVGCSVAVLFVPRSTGFRQFTKLSNATIHASCSLWTVSNVSKFTSVCQITLYNLILGWKDFAVIYHSTWMQKQLHRCVYHFLKYCRFIQDWVFEGVCRDVYDEFMIQVNTDFLRFRGMCVFSLFRRIITISWFPACQQSVFSVKKSNAFIIEWLLYTNYR